MIGDTSSPPGVVLWTALFVAVATALKGIKDVASGWLEGRSKVGESGRLSLESLAERLDRDNEQLREERDEQAQTIKALNQTVAHQGIRIAELREQITVLNRRLADMEPRGRR